MGRLQALPGQICVTRSMSKEKLRITVGVVKSTRRKGKAGRLTDLGNNHHCQNQLRKSCGLCWGCVIARVCGKWFKSNKVGPEHVRYMGMDLP